MYLHSGITTDVYSCERCSPISCSEWAEGSTSTVAVGVAKPLPWRWLPPRAEPLLHREGHTRTAKNLH